MGNWGIFFNIMDAIILHMNGMMGFQLTVRDTRAVAVSILVPTILWTVIGRLIVHFFAARSGWSKASFSPWPISVMVGLLSCPLSFSLYTFYSLMSKAPISVFGVATALFMSVLLGMIMFVPVCLIIIPTFVAYVRSAARGDRFARDSTIYAVCAVCLGVQYYYSIFVAGEMRS